MTHPILRQSVEAFAVHMENRLRQNDHKGGWDDCDPEWLFARLVEELGELAAAVAGNRPGRVKGECYDVANFAMMLAERVRLREALVLAGTQS